MASSYRYTRKAPHLDFFQSADQYNAGVPNMQPPLHREYLPVHLDDALTFAPGVPDIRGFEVNTPNGDTLGRITAYLVDTASGEIAYAYVTMAGPRMVVVPTWWFTIMAERRLVTMEGGLPVLFQAPEATFTADDATRADRYWISYLRDQAA